MTDNVTAYRLAASRSEIDNALQGLGIVSHHDIGDERQTARLRNEFLGAHAASSPESCPPNLPLQGVHKFAVVQESLSFSSKRLIGGGRAQMNGPEYETQRAPRLVGFAGSGRRAMSLAGGDGA